jgi:hypothetical protein
MIPVLVKSVLLRSGEGTAYPSGAPEFTQIVGGVCVLCVMFCKSLLHQVSIAAIIFFFKLFSNVSVYMSIV